MNLWRKREAPDVARIQQLHAAGLTYRTIGERYGYSKETIRKLVAALPADQQAQEPPVGSR